HTRFSRDWSSDVCSSDLDLVLDDAGNFCGADIHYLPFHRLGERIETRADRAVDALGTDCDHETAKQVRIDPRGQLHIATFAGLRSEEHTSELQSRENLVC